MALAQAGAFSGLDVAACNYAWMVSVRGNLPAVTGDLDRQTWDRELEAGLPRTLAYLYRASGDHIAAMAWAERAGDPDFIWAIYLSSARWQTLASLMHLGSGRETGLRRYRVLGHAAMFHHWAGDDRLADPVLADLEKQARTLPKADDPFGIDSDIAAPFLVCGQSSRAVRVLLESNRTGDALEILLEQQRYSEAFEVAGKWLGPATMPATAPAAKLASKISVTREANELLELGRVLADLGLADQAKARFAQAFVATDGYFMRAQAIRAELKAGFYDQAAEHWLTSQRASADPWVMERALDIVKPPSVPREWWEALRRAHPQDSVAQLLRRLTASACEKDDGGILASLLADQLAAKAHKTAQRPATQPTYRSLYGIAALESAAPAAWITSHLVPAAQADSTGELALVLGIMALHAQRWDDAQTWLSLSQQRHHNDPTRTVALGLALIKSGHANEGRQWVQTGWMMALSLSSRHEILSLCADPGRELGALDPLLESLAGLPAEAMPFWFDNLYPSDPREPIRDPLASAERWRIFEDLGHATVEYVSFEHGLRAKGLLAQGKEDAALAEIALAREATPGNIVMAGSLVADLDRHGYHDRATALFDQVWDFHARLLSSYPRSPKVHGDLARLAALGQHRLPEGMSHAQELIRLKPDSGASYFTLAEVCLAGGTADQALIANQQAQVLAPGQPYLRAQRRRIEQALAAATQPATAPARTK